MDAINPEYEQIKAKYNDLKEKAGFFERHGVANSSEIEEALALIRMRKDRGFNTTTDYMMEFDGQLEVCT